MKKLIPQIFEIVKEDVKKTVGRHRAGISLGLVEMGMFNGKFVGVMSFPPGTDIVINKTPLKVILEEQPYEIVWAYTYHILLTGYVYALGVWDEYQCREITRRITEEIFKEPDHPAMVLANKGIGAYFPNLNLIYRPPEKRPEGISIEYISGYDKNSYDYY